MILLKSKPTHNSPLTISLRCTGQSLYSGLWVTIWCGPVTSLPSFPTVLYPAHLFELSQLFSVPWMCQASSHPGTLTFAALFTQDTFFSLTWHTPLPCFGAFAQMSLSQWDFLHLFKPTKSPTTFPDLFSIVFTWAIDTLYILVIIFSSSSSENKVHQGRDVCLVHCCIPHLASRLAHERHSTGVWTESVSEYERLDLRWDFYDPMKCGSSFT